jgi:hypothetical protein
MSNVSLCALCNVVVYGDVPPGMVGLCPYCAVATVRNSVSPERWDEIENDDRTLSPHPTHPKEVQA